MNQSGLVIQAGTIVIPDKTRVVVKINKEQYIQQYTHLSKCRLTRQVVTVLILVEFQGPGVTHFGKMPGSSQMGLVSILCSF